MFCFCFMSHVLSAVKNMVGGTSYLQIISALNKDTSKEMSRKLKLKKSYFHKKPFTSPWRQERWLPSPRLECCTDTSLTCMNQPWRLRAVTRLPQCFLASLSQHCSNVFFVNTLTQETSASQEGGFMNVIPDDVISVSTRTHTGLWWPLLCSLSVCMCVCVCCPSGDSSTFCVCVFLPDLSRVTWHHCWICAGRCCVKAVFCGVSFTISKQRWQCLPLQSSLSWIRSFDHA